MPIDFLVFCRLTCVGGSENGECPCRGPYECQLKEDPGFARAREEAKARMAAYLARGLENAHPLIKAVFPDLKIKKDDPS